MPEADEETYATVTNADDALATVVGMLSMQNVRDLLVIDDFNADIAKAQERIERCQRGIATAQLMVDARNRVIEAAMAASTRPEPPFFDLDVTHPGGMAGGNRGG